MLIEVTPEFVLGQQIFLGPDDLRFGVGRGFIRPEGAIVIATAEVSDGATDPVLVALCSLLRQDADRVAEVLDLTQSGAASSAEEKWLYLQLRAAFLCRSELRDPLGVVETIYADFNYPSSIDTLVRYMPTDGESASEETIYRRWSEYLDRTQSSMAHHSGDIEQ